MNRSLVALAGLVAVMPLAVEVPGTENGAPPLPGTTRVQVAGGYAYYAFVSRGCEGEVIDRVPAHAADAAVSVDHLIEGTPLRVGVRGGWLRDRIGSSGGGRVYSVPPENTYWNRYVNPNVEFDQGRGAVGLGWVAHEREFITTGEGAREQSSHPLNDLSAHVRVGSEEKYFLVSWMEGMPVATDGGYLAIGAGGRLAARRLAGFVGMGAGGPLEGAGPMVRVDVEVADGLHAGIRLRMGLSDGASTGSAALGLEYRRARR